MDPALFTGVIGMLGALLGAFVNGRFQERAAGRAEAAARADKLYNRRLEAVLTLAEAVSDHRTRMWHAAKPSSRETATNAGGSYRSRVTQPAEQSHARSTLFGS
ncbi:hypothetical protein ACWD0J_33510 [Streptomyces sp. NPDC003011]